jgi:hypothetical protein
MSYTRNFGMRSFANIVRVGRLKTPASSNWNIGASVEHDLSAAGTLKLAVADTAPHPDSGAVVYEHIQYQGTDPFLSTPFDAPYTTVPAARYAQVVHGNGTKVFFKNTAAKTLYDGRTQPAVTIVNMTGLGVGDHLTPDGTGGWKKADLVANPLSAWLRVEALNATTGLVEARFTF